MSQELTWVALASFGLMGLAITLFAGLRGWQGWLELKRLELNGGQSRPSRGPAMEMIEMADLKERIRKLESIAACIDI